MKKIALVGNPNVGKSTVFNELSGMNQHTGNWTGKTVDVAKGKAICDGEEYEIYDLPGTYSLEPNSPEEKVTRDFVLSCVADIIVVVCDATCLERTLGLLLQVCNTSSSVIVCLNLIDEAKKLGIKIDIPRLEEILGLKVIPTSARKKEGIKNLKEGMKEAKRSEKIWENTVQDAEKIAKEVTERTKGKGSRDEKIDKILVGKYTSFPCMLVFLLLLFYITVTLANYPSQLLGYLFNCLEEGALSILTKIDTPLWIISLVCQGIIRIVGWIVSVMLPPMAIFFPLFTLLEDWGYLPRIVFNLDRPFCACGSCGKQALTMCMGFGCNAVGVSGARIIPSKEERLISILTNSLVPCNGRFPTLIMIISVFFVGAGAFSSFKGALLLSLTVVVSVGMTFFSSFILSKIMKKGKRGVFVLEMNHYRTPEILKTLIRSMLDRVSKVLARAVCVALPAGIIIWLVSNITVGETSILVSLARFFDPVGKLLGLDGVIILAFILGLPANEIIVPVALMTYQGAKELLNIGDTAAVGELLMNNGWSMKTAVCMVILVLFHSPCLTTLLTVKKETNSIFYMILAMVFPTIIGVTLCFFINLIW